MKELQEKPKAHVSFSQPRRIKPQSPAELVFNAMDQFKLVEHPLLTRIFPEKMDRS